jgi:hypothetical protein
MAKRRPTNKPFDLNAFSSRFAAETDRGCGVLGGALLDERLCSLLERRLVIPTDREREALVGQSGPIGTFSARIKLARALAWISEDVHWDLERIRTIRNAFAHGFDHDLDFSDQSIAGHCRNLRAAKTVIDYLAYRVGNPGPKLSSDVYRAWETKFSSARWRYQLAVEFIAQHLNELPAAAPAYAGPDLLGAVRALVSGTRIPII